MRHMDDSLALWKSAEDAANRGSAQMEANGQMGAIAMDESKDAIYCKGPCCIY